MPTKLFISYSHQDQEQLNELLESLRPLERDGLVEPWTDRLIDIGEDWRAKLDAAMSDCQLGLLLVSKAFLASDFIDAEEVRPMLERAHGSGLRLVPVLLRECAWSNTALGRLQPLPGWNEYVQTPGDDQAARDQAWNRVETGIRGWVTALDDGQAKAVWTGSPYPGLRAFEEREAQIFTGRDDKTKALVKKLEEGVRFLAVYGASGSGKSSLVRAGLIPQWRRRRSSGAQTPVVILKPNDDGDGNPFTALSVALQPFLAPGCDRGTLKQSLRADPTSISAHIDTALQNLPDDAEFLLVVDQFEELFTVVQKPHRQPFATLLERVLIHPRARVVITVRWDFFHRVEEYPELTDRLNEDGRFVVTPLRPRHYRALIERPAELAGFRFEDGLVDRLLTDAGEGASREGLVPLLQFALAKLYDATGEPAGRDETLPAQGRVFKRSDYDAFGGIKGAVRMAAMDAVADIDNADEVLPRLFGALVTVDASGVKTRRRAARRALERDPVCAALLERLIGDRNHARLLIADEAHVEVAHEVLFDAWPAMADWIATFEYDLQQRDRMSYEARQWEEGGRSDPNLLWSHERQQPLYEALKRLGQPMEQWPEPEKSFLRPERERLLDAIADPATDHPRLDWIGARWAAIGDPRRGVGLDRETGLPDILWSDPVPAGKVELEDVPKVMVIERAFKVAVHPVTRDQYRAFLDAGDGYDNEAWWEDLTKPDPRWPPTGAGGNYPVGLVSWDEAVAYCRWLDNALRERGDVGPGQHVRLPTEWEWQQAATGGDRNREFPWTGPWDATKLNSVESGLMRTTAVGLFPAGMAPCGALDMAGNVWEWCLNKDEDVEEVATGGDDARALRVRCAAVPGSSLGATAAPLIAAGSVRVTGAATAVFGCVCRLPSWRAEHGFTEHCRTVILFTDGRALVVG